MTNMRETMKRDINSGRVLSAQLPFRYIILLVFAGLVVSCFGLVEKTATQKVKPLQEAYNLVYEGKFSSVEEMGSACPDKAQELSAVLGIAKEYKRIEQVRKESKQKSYQEKWEKINALRWGADVNDTNEVNEPSKIFSIAADILDLADENQRKEVLNLSIVQEAIDKAKKEAADYESESKWADAYISCYYWLDQLYKDNNDIEEYSDNLIDKAGVVGVFADSPCETREQRFEKVESSMFKRAIEVIDTTYVNPKYINYSQMALEAIERSKLLTTVIRDSYEQIKESQEENGDDNQQALIKPGDESVKAWFTALDSIKADIEQGDTPVSRDRFLDIFEQILLLNSTTVMLPKNILIDQISIATLSLLDPHTILVWPQNVDDFKKSLMGEFAGIGVLISKESGFLTAASLLPDTPAYTSGLDAGDIIEAVDGVETKDMPINCAVKRITGPAGTDVTLTVRTPGKDEPRDIVITRAKIVVKTVRGWQRTSEAQWRYMVDEENKIGYVKITGFSDATASDFERALKQLEGKGMRGLILDLRSNPGGLLESAVAITDMFIRKGLIVRTQPRWGIPDYKHARSLGTHPDYPLVVLVNSVSASASEIVSGALQDPKHNRAIIVGDQTHGKGSVQTITYRPGGGAQLKYTMAYYHLPSGQRVNSRTDMEKEGRTDWGIKPDIEVKLTRDELIKLSGLQRDNEILAKAGHDIEADPIKRHSLRETLKADPQLSVALLVAKTKLLEKGRALVSAK